MNILDFFSFVYNKTLFNGMLRNREITNGEGGSWFKYI